MKEKQLDFANLFQDSEEAPQANSAATQESPGRASTPGLTEKPGMLRALQELRRLMRPDRARSFGKNASHPTR